MANHHRGEIDAVLDGLNHRLCLTLGALAELEATFGDEDMLALAERFATGRLAARDALRIIGAGLRGAGADFTDADVARMRGEGGAAGFVDIVGRLLSATFGTTHGTSAKSDEEHPGDRAGSLAKSRAPEEGRAAPPPFPGAR